MIKAVNILNSKNAFWVTLCLVAVVLFFLAPNAAVNVDEQLHYPHAKKVVNWYFTGGEDQSSLDTPQTNLKYYGQSVDNFTALFNRVFNVKNEFLVRHYTGAFFFLILLLFTGILARKLSNSWLVAIFSILALVFMPRLSGQAFGNLKDIPFAAGYMAGLLIIVQFLKELPYPRWKTIILLGLAIAFTVSVRAGGFILFVYLGISVIIFFGVRPFYFKQIISSRNLLVRLLGKLAAIGFIGYFAGLIFWPFALQNIFLNPLESLRVMEHYQVSIRQIFQGELIWSTMLPWYYFPKWLLISTTGFVLTGFFLFFLFFIVQIVKNKNLSHQVLFEGFLLFPMLFPVIYVIAIDSNLYSGVRQMLFILPLMGLLATLGIYKTLRLIALKQNILVYPFFVLFFFMLVWPLKHQILTFPVDYVYFNVLAGGNKNAWGDYEYDYYFHGLKKPAEYLVNLVGDENVTVAMNADLPNYFDDKPNITYKYSNFIERSSNDWDYGLFGVNYVHPHLLKNNLWKPSETLKTFYQRGNPVAVLVKRTDKFDFYGIVKINKLSLQKGALFLERALEDDPNNVWLYVNLAKAKLAAQDLDGFRRYIDKGKEIHPFYEPFFFLEASQLFYAGEYQSALQKLNELFIINPRYHQAEQLYKVLKEKEN